VVEVDDEPELDLIVLMIEELQLQKSSLHRTALASTLIISSREVVRKNLLPLVTLDLLLPFFSLKFTTGGRRFVGSAKEDDGVVLVVLEARRHLPEV
jgi:hypothetical protein